MPAIARAANCRASGPAPRAAISTNVSPLRDRVAIAIKPSVSGSGLAAKIATVQLSSVEFADGMAFPFEKELSLRKA